jgi:xylan 1,4-beta-xylosidase
MNKRTALLLLCFFFLATGKAQSFTNPVLAGYYPDPSICKTGDDYYLINSSFAHYPGIPVFHSKDLLNWQQIGYAMNRPEQLNLEGAGVSRGLFAPAISYHNGLFYIVCTEVSKLGNFVITAKDPKGPWSNPVKLPEVNGIDPSLFFDNNGKAWIVFNSTPPGNKSLWDGHRTIRMFEFDPVNLKVIGEEKLLVNGGTDISKKPVWIEGPHIYQKDGWYYLLCAEGGTGYNHSEVVFRSKTVDGPYLPYEKNPVLTQRHLDPKRKNPITTTGHADLVEDKDGNWWAVFLGCRPYEGDYYNTGRETFMAPVKWENGWPVFDPGGDEVKYSYPVNAQINNSFEKLNGNYLFRDEFTANTLNLRYRFLRTVTEDWHHLSPANGSLTIKLRKETCSGKSNPSFIGFHQPHLKGHAATSIRFTPNTENEKAGLIVFQNETHYYYLCQSIVNNKTVVQLYKDSSLLESIPIKQNKNSPLFFKIEADNGKYSFYYATKKNRWKSLLANADGKYLSTKDAGGFVGCLYAMYATSNGKSSENSAAYDWFEVKNNDTVYKQSD